MHCGVLEDPGWEDPVGWWEDPNALWGAGGPGVGGPRGMVGGPQCIVGCWRTRGGRTPWDGERTPMHCGVLEVPSALWDGGGPGVGGLHGMVGGP